MGNHANLLMVFNIPPRLSMTMRTPGGLHATWRHIDFAARTLHASAVIQQLLKPVWWPLPQRVWISNVECLGAYNLQLSYLPTLKGVLSVSLCAIVHRLGPVFLMRPHSNS